MSDEITDAQPVCLAAGRLYDRRWCRRQAKQVIRQAVRQATDEQLVELLDAARRFQMPWQCEKRCLAARLSHPQTWADQTKYGFTINFAYFWLADDNEKRQRLLIPIINAAISERRG